MGGRNQCIAAFVRTQVDELRADDVVELERAASTAPATSRSTSPTMLSPSRLRETSQRSSRASPSWRWRRPTGPLRARPQSTKWRRITHVRSPAICRRPRPRCFSSRAHRCRRTGKDVRASRSLRSDAVIMSGDSRKRRSVDGGEGGRDPGPAKVLEDLRAELELARGKAAGTDVQFPVETVTVELKVGATRSKEGRTGFRVPLVGAELGGVGWY